MKQSFFEPALNQAFRITNVPAAPELRLAQCVLLGGGSLTSGGREPFRLLFVGPKTPVLIQGIYALQNDSVGDVEIFLVPIGPGSEGMRYEAIFN